MTGHDTGEFTVLLHRAQAGDREAEESLFRLVYAELRAMARRRMAAVPASDTLQPTALVNEAYLRLTQRRGLDMAGRKHFFALAARAMHDILVEQARRHAARVRGGGRDRLPLSDQLVADERSIDELLAVSEALQALRAQQPLATDVAELRIFVGFTHEEVAEALEVPLIRARREWAYARAFLQERLDGGASGDVDPRGG